MYKSPIEIMLEHMRCKMDDDIYTAVLNYGINVDKEELLRALEYDRGQYEAGYRDGELEAIKHGRWIEQTAPRWKTWCCSECKTLGSPHWKRCPVCEAKMTGGKEDG